MGVPALGRTVLELATDSSGFFSDLDKAERRVVNLGGVFDKAGKGLQGVGSGVKNFGDTVNKSMASAETGTQRLSLSLKSLGGALAGFVSVRAITSAVSSYTELTGKLTDLSAKTGISTTELQKLKYAAELSGGSLEGVTNAVKFMAKHLVEGDKSAVEAMKRLGLNINDIRQMQPGEAFNAVAEAIGKIPNPMEQSTLAMQLFGRSGADVLPMIKAGLTDAYQAAERLGIVMDEETVAAGDRLGDTFTTISAVGQGVIGKVLGPMVPAIQMVADAMTSLGDLVIWLQGAFTTLLKWGIQAIKFFIDAGIKVTEFASSIPILGDSMRDVDKAALQSAKGWSVWFDDMAKGMDVTVPKAAKQTTSLKTAVGTLTEEQKKNSKSTDDASRSSKEHAKAMDDQARKAVQLYKDVKQAQQGLEEMYRETLRLGAAGGFFATRGMSGNVLELTQSVEQAVDQIQIMRGTIELPVNNASMTEFFESIKVQSQGIGGEVRDSLMGVVGNIPGLLQQAFTGGGGILGAFKAIGVQLADVVMAPLLAKIKSLGNSKLLQGAIGVGTAGGAAIGGVMGGGMGSTVGGIAAGVGGSALAATGAFAGVGGAIALGAATMGIGAAAVGVALLLKKAFSNAGRESVEAFAEGMGGFEALHEQLLKGGEAGEQLWIKLTQGTGRGNKEQAKRNIQEVQEFLQNLTNAQLEAGENASAAVAAITEKYAEALSAIDSERKTLMERISAEMPEEVMGIQETLDRARVEQLDKEKAAIEEKRQMEMDAAQEALEEAAGNAQSVLDIIRDIFSKGVTIPVRYEYGNQPRPPGSSDSGPSVSYAARGGVVVPGGVVPFADGGFVSGLMAASRKLRSFDPRGTDSVPALLTPGELVLTQDQQAEMARSMRSILSGINVDRIHTMGNGMIGMRSEQAAAPTVTNHITVPVTIQAIDGASVERVVQSREFGESLKKAITNDRHGLRNHLEVVLA